MKPEEVEGVVLTSSPSLTEDRTAMAEAIPAFLA